MVVLTYQLIANLLVLISYIDQWQHTPNFLICLFCLGGPARVRFFSVVEVIYPSLE
jgi:hypothetical protein